MKKYIRRMAAACLAFAIVLPSAAFGQTDDFIFNDPVRSTFEAAKDGPATVINAQYTDLDGHWAKQAAVRETALNVIKGYEKAYQPQKAVTNEEAIAFVLRAIGYETRAVALGNTLAAQYPNEPAENLWSLGYLDFARQLGLIDNAAYQASLPISADPNLTAQLQPGVFVKTADARREDVAYWIYRAVNAQVPETFTQKPMQKLFNFSDWKDVSAPRTEAVEAVAGAGIMGAGGGKFNPKSSMTRAEMAAAMANLDSVHFKTMNMTRREGTVAGFREGRLTTTGESAVSRNYYVRSGDGKADVLSYVYTAGSSPQRAITDAPVYRNGAALGLAALEEGDRIEYIADADGALLYVNVTKPVTKREFTGMLEQISQSANQLTLKDDLGKAYTFKLAEGLIDSRGGAWSIKMDEKWQDIAALPYGSSLKLKLVNDTVTEISFIGRPVLVNELRGIVVDNDADLGFITIRTGDGKTVTKQYNEGDMTVRKRQYYDNEDTIGYITRMFPYFDYDPLATVISDVEPGDVVFLTLNKADPALIDAVSASANYQARYGKIRSITRGGDMFTVLIEYENKQTSAFEVPAGIFISKGGKPIDQNAIQTGDWAKLLINEAIIEPGYTIEGVKEMTIEGGEHFVTGLYKGTLTGVNAIQSSISLEGAQTLAKTGWVNYKDIADFNINNKNIEYYYNDKRVSLDFAAKNLKNGGATAYIATETAFSGERVTKVTFRAGRDEALDPDIAMDADGAGAFTILSHGDKIATDVGTIVRRYGRLVTGSDVLPGDYVRVAINGGGKAAIVDITDEPDTSRVMIARGRIGSVKEGQSFKTQSISQLNGVTWVYTPIQREYAIDGKTVFIGEEGTVSRDTFIGYTEGSVVDHVYNIVTDGSRAAFVVDAPYAYKAVRGTVYKLEDEAALIKDVYYLDEATNQWRPISTQNSTGTVNLYPNSIIAKQNAVVPAGKLGVGDSLLIMTNVLPARPQAGLTVDGFIVIVER